MNNNSRDERSRWAPALNVVLALFVITTVVSLILFPMYARSRIPGRNPCQNTIQEMAIAIQVYCNDYDSKLPSSVLVSHSKKWNKADFLKFATKRGQLPPTGKRQTYVEILYNHIKSRDIPFCPYDPACDKIDRNTQASYWWKTAVDKAWYGEGCKKPCREEGDFGYPSDQVILYEHAGFHAGGDSLKNGVRITVAYMDTHVKSSIAIKNATSGDPKNCAANDDGEPMYFNYNLDKDKGLSSDSVPAKFVDPSVYGDRF